MTWLFAGAFEAARVVFIVESAITSKGQATIPKASREHLRLKPGDRFKFFMHPDGSVVLLPKRPASILRGIVRSHERSIVRDSGRGDKTVRGVAVEIFKFDREQRDFPRERQFDDAGFRALQIDVQRAAPINFELPGRHVRVHGVGV
jgi:antitoxin PrlF